LRYIAVCCENRSFSEPRQEGRKNKARSVAESPANPAGLVQRQKQPGAAGVAEAVRQSPDNLIQSHDAAETGISEDLVCLAKRKVLCGEQHDVATAGGLDAFHRNLRSIFGRSLGA